VHTVLAATVLASGSTADSGNGPAATMGLIVVLVLVVACVVLFRSMSGRIKRLPKSFDPPAEAGRPADDKHDQPAPQ
jgi:hypothetical protein